MVLFTVGCSYRFVDSTPASDYALVSVRNATSEPDLASLLEEEMRRNGGFSRRSESRLSITVSNFTERVGSVSSGGIPVRQNLTMEVAWKVEGTQLKQATFGKEVAAQSYPYSADLPTLDWNRNAAIRLLTEKAARSVLERLGKGL